MGQKASTEKLRRRSVLSVHNMAVANIYLSRWSTKPTTAGAIHH